MSDLSGATKIPVWDGNPENLPLWQKFLYNGKEYLTIIRKGNRRVLSVETGCIDTAMTVRVGGVNTGSVVADVLIKSGVTTNEKLATLVERNDEAGIKKLVLNFTSLAKKQRLPREWCKSKGISLDEILEAEVASKVIAHILFATL